MPSTILTNLQGVSIPHEIVVSLRQRGMLNLGIDNAIAQDISAQQNAGPTKTTTVPAFHFWNWVAIVIFIGSVYWSFAQAWWWFIIGFVVMRALWRANITGNAENLLDAAMVDKEFYDKVLSIHGWQYQVSEEHLAEFAPFLNSESGMPGPH
jgi:hypothetical protein